MEISAYKDAVTVQVAAIDKEIEVIEKATDNFIEATDKKIEVIEKATDNFIEATDKKIEVIEKATDKKIEAIDKKTQAIATDTKATLVLVVFAVVAGVVVGQRAKDWQCKSPWEWKSAPAFYLGSCCFCIQLSDHISQPIKLFVILISPFHVQAVE